MSGQTSWSGQVRISLRDKAAPGLTREFVANGESEFSLDAIPPGRWLIEVTSSTKPLAVTSVRFGNQQGPEPILIAESGNPPLEITLSDQTGTVAGTMLDGNRQPVKGALIVVRQPGGPILGRTYRTGADGSFRVADPPPGQYEVSAWVEAGAGGLQ